MEDDSRIIPLTQGKVTIVDACDFEWLSQWNWFTSKVKKKTGWLFYAVRHGKTVNGFRPHLRMHREIVQAPEGMDVDHKDGDGLNNRRLNLRTCTAMQNCANRHASGGASLYLGVFRSSHAEELWISSICSGYSTVKLGIWPTEYLAALAYDSAARILHHEFASPNFPDIPQRYESIEAIRAEGRRLSRIRLLARGPVDYQSSRRIEFNGETRTIAGWSRHLGVHIDAIRTRLWKGESIERAFSTERLRPLRRSGAS